MENDYAEKQLIRIEVGLRTKDKVTLKVVAAGGWIKFLEENKNRNCVMFEMRVFGLTYRAIGDYFDLSRERVRQLVMKQTRKRLNANGY